MKAQIVSFKCLLRNVTGQLISSSFNRDVLTSISLGNEPLRALAQGLQGLKKGDRRSIFVKAEEAYGFYDPKKIYSVPRVKIPGFRSIRVGQIVSILAKTGKIRTYRILQIQDKTVLLDENHPLAGQDLIFEIEATEARDATAKEITEAQNLISKQWVH